MLTSEEFPENLAELSQKIRWNDISPQKGVRGIKLKSDAEKIYISKRGSCNFSNYLYPAAKSYLEALGKDKEYKIVGIIKGHQHWPGVTKLNDVETEKKLADVNNKLYLKQDNSDEIKDLPVYVLSAMSNIENYNKKGKMPGGYGEVSFDTSKSNWTITPRNYQLNKFRPD